MLPCQTVVLSATDTGAKNCMLYALLSGRVVRCWSVDLLRRVSAIGERRK